MDLIIDLGNTNKKLALYQDGKLSVMQMFPEINMRVIRNFVKQPPGIENCILSSVINHPESINHYLKNHFRLIELNENTPIPVKNLYRHPETLGKDRLAAAVAGASIFPDRDVLVINAGSCITYEFINKRNEYLGGAISPGSQMRFMALNTFTGKLPLITLKESHDLTGNDTEHSVLSGVVNGIIKEIEGNVALYRKKYRS